MSPAPSVIDSAVKRALSLAAAVSLGAVPPAFVTALLIASILVDCSVRAVLPGTFVASLVPALVAAAFALFGRARTRRESIVTGILAFGGLFALFVGPVVAIVTAGLVAALFVFPAAVLLFAFVSLGVPVFVLTLHSSSARLHRVLLAAAAVVPVAVFVLRETGKSCHLIL